MDKITRIRQEIERLKKLLEESTYYLDNSQQALGYSFALDDFNEFLDTLSEEPDKSLEEAAESHTFFAANQPGQEWETHDVTDAFIAGAEWMAGHFEKERLRDCDELTPEDAQLEDDFVESHFKKNQRTPTFIDAIKYGAEWQKSQMMEEAVEGRVFMSFAPGHNQMVMADVDLPTNTKVRILVLKEEEENK